MTLYDIATLHDIVKICYSHRWNIGKDQFTGAFALIKILKIMEREGINLNELSSYLNDLMNGCDDNGVLDDYPL